MISIRFYPDARPTRLHGYRSAPPASAFIRRFAPAAPEAEYHEHLRALGVPVSLSARLRGFLQRRGARIRCVAGRLR